ncbi:MAG TPA: pirin family protein [Jatrophihabitans sp.]|nr:pirin family protein [Jatrophihabitans sp.]
MAESVVLHRAADRLQTRTPWLHSQHSFSFGHQYRAGNTHHGLLLVNNEDLVRPGTGFDTHPHRDMEIVTWVLTGSLVHQDSAGNSGVIYPGLAQRMSAGSGIMHSERNDSWRLDAGPPHSDPVHFVQMWVSPDERGIEPGYQQAEVGPELLSGGLVPVASGLPAHAGSSAIRIRNSQAGLHVARLRTGQQVQLPDAPYLHLFLARGQAELEAVGLLEAGDAVRLTGTGGHRLTAVTAAEVLVWEMHASLAG